MVDVNLNVWLIEINSSPDLSYSTATTKALIRRALPDMVNVIVE